MELKRRPVQAPRNDCQENKCHAKTHDMRLVAIFVLLWDVMAFCAAAAALQTVAFPDGFRVEILRSELASKMIHAKPPLGEAEKIAPPSYSHGLDTVFYRAWIERRGAGQDGHFQRATWSFSSGTPGLMLLVRTVEGSGAAYPGSVCSMDGDSKYHEWSEPVRIGSCIKELDSMPAGSIEDLPLHFQITDGGDGWRDMDGPVIFDSSEGVGICSVHVFPRRIPELKLRVMRKGWPTQILTLKNPGYQPSAPPFVANAKAPAVRFNELFEVTLRTLDIRMDGKGKRFRPMLGHKAFITPSGWRRNSVQSLTAAYDATGNYYPAGRFMDRITPLPGEHLFRLTYRLQKSMELYPWRESETEIIAEGKADAVGGLPTASLNHRGRELGLKRIEFLPPQRKDRSLYFNLPWNFRFTLHGKDDGSPELDDMHVCILTETAGAQKEINGPKTGSSVLKVLGLFQVRNYDLDYYWLGTLKPGEAFRVGLIKKKFEEFEFLVDLDAAK
jgi:hypothetical protein